MRRRRSAALDVARGEEGFIVATAIIVMMIVLSISVALLANGDVQQRAAGRQGQTEAAFALAEAALNAQIFELSSSWPTAAGNAAGAYPTSCSAANLGASFCSNPSNTSGSGSFGNGYSGGNAVGTCPAGTAGDAWSSSTTVSNGWTTYVRDDGAGTASLFASATNRTQPAYDANGDSVLWVRVSATVNCRTVTLLQRVTQQQVALNFPSLVVNANGFETSNSGNKLIVDTQGNASQASQVSVRCKPKLSGPGVNTQCTYYTKDSQVSPGPNYASPPAPAQTLTAAQLNAVKVQATANGTDFEGPGNCPTSMAQLAGGPVFIENCGDLSFTGNQPANSAASPGWIVLYNGTLTLGGTTAFYGVIYAANLQGATGDVVTLHGNASVTGGIDVDGNGTINFGSSGQNIQYDPNAFARLAINGGAAGTPNTFRQLPLTQ